MIVPQHDSTSSGECATIHHRPHTGSRRSRGNETRFNLEAKPFRIRADRVSLVTSTATIFLLGWLTGLAAEPRNISAIQSLKPGKGRELIQVNCMPCHSTAIIAATHATRERWDELITTMQQKHGLWPLVPATRNQILDYLAATQPPSDPALDAAKQAPWAEPLYRPNPLW
jgi:hypothetical protein